MRDKMINFSFDQFQRFSVCRRILDIITEKGRGKGGFILDLGGSDGSVFESADLEYVKVVADSHVIPADESILYIISDAVNLPFNARAFSISISLDTFEHILPSKRPDYVRELQRITGQHIICSFPQGNEENEQVEKLLGRIISAIQKKEDTYLAQHIANRLPEEHDITEHIDPDACSIISFGTGNTYIWFFMSVLKRIFSFYGYEYFFTDLVKELDSFYNTYIAEKDNIPPYYRLFTLISYDSIDADQKNRIEAINKQENDDFMLRKDLLPYFAVNYGISALKADANHINDLYGLMKGYETHFEEFHKIIREKDHLLVKYFEYLKQKEKAIEFLRNENKDLKSEVKKMANLGYCFAKFFKNIFKSKDQN